MSTGGRVARNASLLTAATAVSRLSTFVLAVVLARALGPADYGRYGIALALGLLLVPVADLGVTGYIGREAARDRATADAQVARLARARALATLGLTVVVAGGAALVLDDERLVAAIAVMLVATAADGFSTFVYGYFQGRERMGLEAWTTVAAGVLRLGGGLVLLAAVDELIPVLAWVAAVALAQLALAGARLRQATRQTSRRAAVNWRAVGAMGLVTVFVMVYLRADTVLVGWLLGEDQAGFYTAAYTVMTALQIVPWMLALALTPVFARAFRRDPERFEGAWQQGTLAVLAIAAPLALAACLLAGPAMERLFGADYDPGAAALAVLVWASPLIALNALIAAVLRASGDEGRLALATGVGAVLNVAANLVLIEAVGIEGAAAVTIASEAAVFCGLVAVAVRRRLVPLPQLPWLRLAGALAVLAALALAARDAPVELAALLALAGYAAVLLLTRVVGRDEWRMLRAALRPG